MAGIPGLTINSGNGAKLFTNTPAKPLVITQNQPGLQFNHVPGQVLSASTGPSGGGSLSSPQQSVNSAPFDAAANAAKQQNDALLSSLNTQYDYNAAQAQNQLGDLGNQKDQATTALNNELDSVRGQVNTEKNTAQTNNENQIIDAGSIAHSTQLQNRNILRSLGILNSSAAGESLAKPMNQFDQQRAQLGQQLQQRFSQLDDFLNTQVASHQAAVQSIQQNYQSLVGKIQTDLRFNDRQRADAIQAANAALTGHLADIQNSLLNYQQQVNAAKQQYGNQAAQVIQQYSQPTANLSAIQNTAVQPEQATGSKLSTNIFQDPNKQDQIGANNFLSSTA